MKLITIAAGRGTRVQTENYIPKALLKVKEKTLLEWSIDSFHNTRAQGTIKPKDLVFVFLRDDVENFGIKELIRDTFGDVAKLVILEEFTAGPAETVKIAVESLISNGDISDSEVVIINDCDHSFRNLSMQRFIQNPMRPQQIIVFETDKIESDLSWSFLKRDMGKIIGIVEKPKESELENIDTSAGLVGVYIFSSAQFLLELYEKMITSSFSGELFISHLINCAINQYSEHGVVAAKIKDFVPLGSHEQIAEALNGKLLSSGYKESATLFVDLDGTLIPHDSSKYLGSGVYRELEELSPSSISSVNQLFWNGNKIILTTARHESSRDSLVKDLYKLGLNYDNLLMGIGGGPRVLINDSKPSLPGFPTAFTVNTTRNKCAIAQVANFIETLEAMKLIEVFPNESGETTILFESDKEYYVRKISQPTTSSKELIEYQNSWLRLVREFLPNMVPRIIKSETSTQNSVAFYDMEYIENLRPLGEYIFESAIKESITTIDELSHGLQLIYDKFKVPEFVDMTSFFDVIELKAIPGIEKGLKLLEYNCEWDEFPLKVNGELVVNVLNDVKVFLSRKNPKLRKMLEMEKFHPTLIHGDPTLSNIVMGGDNRIYLLDPIGARVDPNFNFLNDGIGRSNPVYDHSRIRLSLLDEYERWDGDLVLSKGGTFTEVSFDKRASAAEYYEYFDSKWSAINPLQDNKIKDLVYFTTLARILPYKSHIKHKEAFYILHLLSAEWQKIKSSLS